MTAIAQKGINVTVDELIQLRFDAAALSTPKQRATRHGLAGLYLSKFHGRGMTFAETRAYQPGDDIRTMDWRVTARTGKPHTKLFHEEQERPIFFVADFGPSMLFGTRVAFKSVIAAKATALLAWTALQQGDRVGALLFSGAHHQALRPGTGQRHVLQLLNNLAQATQISSSQTDPDDLANALARLRHVARPGSLIFILSDFRHLNQEACHFLRLLSQHNDVMAGFISDPLEQCLPPPGEYRLTDGKQFMQLATGNQTLRTQYQHDFEQRFDDFKSQCRRAGVTHFRLDTDRPIVPALKKGLYR